MKPYRTIETTVNLKGLGSKDADGPSGAPERAAFRPATADVLDHQFFQMNLDFWSQIYPAVGHHLRQMTPERSRLLISDDGDFDIEIRGFPLIGGSKRMAAKGFDGCHKVNRLVDPPGGAEGIEDDLIERMRRRMEEANGDPFPAHPLGPECFHLGVFGSGLGHHLPPLVAATQCRNLIIVEPEIEFLYHSLYTFDWGTFLRKFTTGDRQVQMIFESDPKVIELNFRDYIRFVGPHYVDGMTLVRTYPDAVLEAAHDHIVVNAGHLNGGMSFVLDECDMMRNAYNNMKRHRGYYYKRRDNKIPLPAFLVGSGPSLNDSIEIIRENKDRAMIISCGTALRVLCNNGIKPDFHVEMENIIEIPDIIAAEAARNDISSVRLIASNTTSPGIDQHFADVVYYFRNNLAPSPLFTPEDETWVSLAMPTVANLGFSFAQEFGCRTIYVFGVDLGAKDNVSHHAKGSAYETGEAPYRSHLDIPMPTNFGDGEVLTDKEYLWSKDVLELAARSYPEPDRRHYNCSNGLRIEGLEPLRASMILIEPAPRPKAEIIDEAISRYPVYTDTHFERAWNLEDRFAKLEAFRSRLHGYLGGEPADETSDPGADGPPKQGWLASQKSGSQPVFAQEFMDRLAAQFYSASNSKTVEDYFFQGSLFYPMRALHYYAARTLPGAKREQIVEIGKSEIGRHIDDVADQVRELYNSLN